MNAFYEAQDKKLWIAASDGDVEVVKELLQRGGVNVDWKYGKYEEAPLHKACEGNYVEMVELLIRHGANVDARTEWLATPLHMACGLGHSDIVQLLVQNHANVRARTTDQNTPLHKASAKGHVPIVQYLLEHGAGPDVHLPNNKQKTPLGLAREWGHEDVVRVLDSHVAAFEKAPASSTDKELLLQAAKEGNRRSVQNIIHQIWNKGGLLLELNYQDANGWTPLHWAVWNGHADVVEELVRNKNEKISEHVDVNASNQGGDTPLHDACERGDVDATRLLLNHPNIDVNLPNGYDTFPLHWACRNGHWDIVQMLLAKGAKVNSPTKQGYTGLHWSCRGGHLKIVNLLLRQNGINVHARLYDGRDRRTALDIARDKGHTDVVQAIEAHILEASKQQRLASSSTSRRGRDASSTKDFVASLFGAARAGDAPQVERILQQGIDANSRNDLNETPLHWASREGLSGVVEVLLNQERIDVNAQSVKGETPLYMACEYNNLEAASLLLTHADVDLDVKNHLSRTALDVARSKGHVDVAELLEAHGAQQPRGRDASLKEDLITSLFRAAGDGDVKQVDQILQRGVNVNSRNHLEETPLHWASWKGQSAVIQLLLNQEGIDINAQTVKGETPLYMACEYRHLESASLLLSYPAIDVNMKSHKQNTPLHLASSNGRLEVVNLLLSHKDINVHVRNKHGKTPLECANILGRSKVSEALEKYIGVRSKIEMSAKKSAEEDERLQSSEIITTGMTDTGMQDNNAKASNAEARLAKNKEACTSFDSDTTAEHAQSNQFEGSKEVKDNARSMVDARNALVRALLSKEVEADAYIPFGYIETITRKWDERLGHGGFGSVYKATDSEVCLAVAVKTIESDKIINTAKGSFNDEIQNMANLSHPNIVRYLGYSIGKDLNGTDIHCMILEYAGGGSVGSILGSEAKRVKFDPSKRLYVVESLVSALEYLHNNHIFHRDVKPENCCLRENWEDDPHLLLVDFGIAERITNFDAESRDLTSAPGTELFMAPEYLNRANPRFTAKSEVYSVGVSLVALLIGDRLYSDSFSPRSCTVEGILGLLDDSAGTWRPASLAEQLAKLAIQCLSSKEDDRPAMSYLLSSFKDLRSKAGAMHLLPQSRITEIRTHRSRSGPSTLRPVENVTKCVSCGLRRTDGALCANGHLTCSDGTCLEELLRSQKGRKKYQCGATRCTKHFLLSDMYEKITMELYSELLQDEVRSAAMEDLSQMIQQQFRMVTESVKTGFAGVQHGLASIQAEVLSSRDAIIANISSVKQNNLDILEVDQVLRQMKRIAGTIERRERKLEFQMENMLRPEDLQRTEEKLSKEIHDLGHQFSSAVAQHACGHLQCPRLFVMLPIRSQRRSFMRITVAQEYQLYFLCAFDRSLIKTPITVKRVREWAMKASPVLMYVIFALKVLVTVYGVPVPHLPDFVPGSTDEERIGQALEEMMILLDHDSHQDLEDWVGDCRVDTAILGPSIEEKRRQIPAEAYTEVALRAYKPKNSGWMNEMQLVGQNGEFAWVKNENVDAWKNARD